MEKEQFKLINRALDKIDKKSVIFMIFFLIAGMFLGYILAIYQINNILMSIGGA